MHVNIKGWLLRVDWMRTMINGEGIERAKSGRSRAKSGPAPSCGCFTGEHGNLQ